MEWCVARKNESPLTPQADSCQLERNPERAREEPRRRPNVTGSGVHGKGLVPNVRFCNNVRTVSKRAGRYQRNERASRLQELLLARPQKSESQTWIPQKQLADILTKGSFAREARNHLLRSFNIMDISKVSSTHFSPFSFPQTRSKSDKTGRKTRNI